MTQTRKTAGMLSLQAASDNHVYDPLELGYALTDDIAEQLRLCAQTHDSKTSETEYVIGWVLASDPLIKGIMRRKFHAHLYLPSPRPNQAMFLYNRELQKFTKRLWVLPNAQTMAILSEMPIVDKKYATMKAWSDAFFQGRFWQFIREQHGITMLSEIEYLQANREKLIQAGCKEIPPGFTESFDFSKIGTYKVVDPDISLTGENSFNNPGKA